MRNPYRTLGVIASLLLPLVAMAADPETKPGQEKTADERAVGEIIRRGHSKEELGTFKAGPESEANKLNAPPEDDSDRPFITLVVTDDPKYAEACDRARADINAQKLKGYILPDDAANSWSHYSVRMWSVKKTDKPQISDSWFAKFGHLLVGQEFPVLVLQPPRNGEHGDNKAIMGLVYGYGNNGDYSIEPDFTMSQIKSIIDEYSQSRYAKGLAKLQRQESWSGHSQRGSKPWPAPFETDADPTDLTQPRKIWPTHLDKPKEPAKPKPYTYSQIRKLAPDASVKWVRDLVKENVTTDDEVTEAYDEWKEEQKAKVAPKEIPAVHPVPPSCPQPATQVAPVAPAVTIPTPAPVVDLPLPPHEIAHDDSAYEEAKTDTPNPTHWGSSLSDVLLPAIVVVLILVVVFLYQKDRKDRESRAVVEKMLQAQRSSSSISPYPPTGTRGPLVPNASQIESNTNASG